VDEDNQNQDTPFVAPDEPTGSTSTSDNVVDEAIKGDVKVGSTITIIETGGLIAGQSKTEPGQQGNPAEAAFEGVRVMAVGEQCLLFLGPYDPGPVATDAFSVKGVFQGSPVRLSS
jgi:hypothetical protein